MTLLGSRSRNQPWYAALCPGGTSPPPVHPTAAAREPGVDFCEIDPGLWKRTPLGCNDGKRTTIQRGPAQRNIILAPVIRDVFFDLDHTLWDFDANAAATLRTLHATHDFNRWFAVDPFIETYTRINHAAWHRFHRGEISQAELRGSRFPDTFRALATDPAHLPADFGELFIHECSGQRGTFPHAHAVLAELRRRGYRLHIITNGFRDSQHRKLAASALAEFFTEVVTTDCAGCSKPDKRIFQHALDRAGATATASVMIGDSLDADVLGALNAGWASAMFFNPDRTHHHLTIPHEITDLRELLEILPATNVQQA
jgi:putative hydrolase of the HAD superfamily